MRIPDQRQCCHIAFRDGLLGQADLDACLTELEALDPEADTQCVLVRRGLMSAEQLDTLASRLHDTATLELPPQGEAPVGGVPEMEGYAILGPLGEGAMGTVWRATQLATRREVALKVLGSGTFGSARARARFEREVELSARLEHPHIARIYDSGLLRGAYYYAMELIEGTHLDDYVEQHGLGPRQILRLLRTVCQAVQHAHQRGVIHRDLKPSNILVTPNGRPHIVDFGLAKACIGEEDEATVSIDGGQAGTPAFMSPEQAAGRIDVIDTRTDVYSLGIILYRLLTGQPPHELSGSTFTILRRIAEEEPRRPRQVCKSIDRDLEALLLKALAHEPDDRYASAAELAHDIGNYLGGEPLLARRATTLYFLRKRIRKYRVGVAIAAAVVLALLAMAGYTAARITQERNLALREAYFANIGLAQTKIDEGQVAQAERLLDHCAPHLRHWEWRRLKHLCHLDLATLPSGHGRVWAMALRPDGKLLATGGEDNTVRLWDMQARRQVRTLAGHAEPVRSLAFSPDGARLASGSADSTIRIWAFDGSRPPVVLEGHKRDIGLATATGKKLGATIYSLAFSPDGTRLASAGGFGDHTVKVWDVETGKPLLSIDADERSVVDVAFSPDGRRVVSSGYDDVVKVWDARSGEPVAAIEGEAGRILAFSPDGTRLLTGTTDGALKLWDPHTLRLLHTVQAHRDSVLAVAISRDGTRIATGGRDNLVKLWDAATRQELATMVGHSGIVRGVAFTPDDARIVSAAADGTIKLWARRAIGRRLTLKGHAKNPTSAAFSPDGKRLVSASRDGTLRLWDLASGKPLRTLEGHADEVWHVAVSPGGTRIASQSKDGTLTMWDAASGEALYSVAEGLTYFGSVAFSPDGTRLLDGGFGRRLKLRDARTGKELREIQADSGTFSPDGEWIASIAYKDDIKLWHADTGKLLRSIPQADGFTVFVAFSPDGKWLASGAADGTVTLWDPRTGRRVRTLAGHTDLPYCAAFSPDVRRIATASRDGTVKLWDAATGRELITLEGNTDWPNFAVFSPDGSTLAAGGPDHTILIRRAEPRH